jgi:hypothetical protein
MRTYEPAQKSDTPSRRLEPDYSLWLCGLGSARHGQFVCSRVSTFRDLWFPGGLRDNFCRRAGFARNAQAPVQRGHEPKDGGHYGRFPDPLGLLWPANSLETGDRMERCGRADQFPQRRRIPSFRPHRKGEANKVTSYQSVSPAPVG